MRITRVVLTCIFTIALGILAKEEAQKKVRVLILGDSLTEGYGVEKEEAFPALLEIKLNQWQKRFKIINGGSSGSTSASGTSRLKWYGKTNPDWVLLALGSNDGLRGIKIDETRKNIEQAILYCQEHGWKVILTGLQLPPNYGPTYNSAFQKIFPDLAKKYKVPLYPFLLEGVAGEVKLNQADGIHPNALGHVVISQGLFNFLKDLFSPQG